MHIHRRWSELGRFLARLRRADATCRVVLLLLLVFAAPLPVAHAAEPLLSTLSRKATGDLDRMVDRREVRALVAHGRMQYEVVKGQQVGIVYDGLVELERWLNRDFAQVVKTGRRSNRLPIRVTIVAVPYDKLYEKLQAGYGDVVASPMLVTDYAAQRVDFTAPFLAEAKEVVVTRKGEELGEGWDAISGRSIYLRFSSGFYRTLLERNKQLEAQGKAPARLIAADEHLADDELMEMVDAGLAPATVTYTYRARVWSQVFANLHVNEQALLLEHGKIAWAVRKGNPQLRDYLDKFVAAHDMSSAQLRGNRYYHNARFARSALDDAGKARFEELVALFRRYADRYSFDHLLLMAQGYQESRLDQQARSQVGAVGIMQVMPQTGAQLKVGDVHQVEPNIHAGTKYLDILRKQYFNGPEIGDLDRVYFSFAAYNAGPGNIRRMRALAAKQGLDPNAWFDNVELVTLQHIGREPVDYVSNISKYYLAYRLYVDNARKT